jgi:hypothetical protein
MAGEIGFGCLQELPGCVNHCEALASVTFGAGIVVIFESGCAVRHFSHLWIASFYGGIKLNP